MCVFFPIYVFMFALDGDGSDEYIRTRCFIRDLFSVSKLDQKRSSFSVIMYNNLIGIY
jgi:hypothetical protein